MALLPKGHYKACKGLRRSRGAPKVFEIDIGTMDSIEGLLGSLILLSILPTETKTDQVSNKSFMNSRRSSVSFALRRNFGRSGFPIISVVKFQTLQATTQQLRL